MRYHGQIGFLFCFCSLPKRLCRLHHQFLSHVKGCRLFSAIIIVLACAGLQCARLSHGVNRRRSAELQCCWAFGLLLQLSCPGPPHCTAECKKVSHLLQLSCLHLNFHQSRPILGSLRSISSNRSAEEQSAPCKQLQCLLASYEAHCKPTLLQHIPCSHFRCSRIDFRRKSCWGSQMSQPCLGTTQLQTMLCAKSHACLPMLAGSTDSRHL